MSSVSLTTPDELKAQIAAGENVVVLDVRSAAEFESLHIAGSYNVPLPLLDDHAVDVAAQLNGPVVIACQSGVRSTDAHAKLTAAGYRDVRVLDGGVPGYRKAGGDVVEGAQRWAMERQVRMVAGSLVLVGIAGGKFVAPQLRTVAGVIGAGLTFSAATNTRAMASVLAKMPWNKTANEPTRESVLEQLSSRTA